VRGVPCGVAAVGRCLTCGRAFCPTHQSRYKNTWSEWSTYSDLCQDCLSERYKAAAAWEQGRPARELLQHEQLEAKYSAARERFHAVTSALVANGCPGLQPRWMPSRTYSRWRHREIRGRLPLADAWPIGEYEWIDPGDPRREVSPSFAQGETFVLPSGDIVPALSDRPRFSRELKLLEGAAAALEKIAADHRVPVPSHPDY
jgi:hypothetical protein